MLKRSLLPLIALMTLYVNASAQTFQNRKALIIGVSNYSAQSQADPLPGVPHDIESAKKIASAMGIPESNFKFLTDSQATKANIMAALKGLGDSNPEGSRTLVYFSGHGVRQFDPNTGSCTEGLLTYEGTEMITHTEFANATQKLNKSADKVITMIDACFSQGVVTSPVASRSMSGPKLTAKFFSKNGPNVDNCPAVNNPVATRGMLSEVTRLGGLQENFVQNL